MKKKSLKKSLLDDMHRYAGYIGAFRNADTEDFRAFEARIRGFAQIIEENFQQIKVSAPIQGSRNHA